MASASVGFLCSTMATGKPLTTNITSARLPLRAGGLSRHSQVTWRTLARRFVEVDEPHLPVALLGLVVPLPLAPQPGEHLPVALNGRTKRLEVFHHGTDGVVRHPGVEPTERLLQLGAEQHPSLAAPQRKGVARRQRRPPDLRRMADHRELNGV